MRSTYQLLIAVSFLVLISIFLVSRTYQSSETSSREIAELRSSIASLKKQINALESESPPTPKFNDKKIQNHLDHLQQQIAILEENQVIQNPKANKFDPWVIQVDKLKGENDKDGDVRENGGKLTYPDRKRAVAVYFQHKIARAKNFFKELSWLHYNWQIITNEYIFIDFYIFAPHSSVEYIPEEWGCIGTEERIPYQSNCVLVPHDPPDDPDYKMYGNLNSLEFLAHEDSNVLDEYDLVLKTDIDIFLTPSFATWFPQGFFVGPGGYGYHEYTQWRLKQVSKKLNLTHRGWHNLGQAWYGPGKRIRDVARLAIQNAIHCWKHEINEPTEWPRWWRTCVMYGSEMALNHLVPDLTFTEELDENPISSKSVFKAKVIHCFHNKAHFNKFVFQTGCYDKINTTGIDHTIVRNWALEIALRGTGVIDDGEFYFDRYPAVEHPESKTVLWPKINWDTLLGAEPYECPEELTEIQN